MLLFHYGRQNLRVARRKDHVLRQLEVEKVVGILALPARLALDSLLLFLLVSCVWERHVSDLASLHGVSRAPRLSSGSF